MNLQTRRPSLPFIRVILGWLAVGLGFGGLLFYIGGFLAGAAYFVIFVSLLLGITGAPLHLLFLRFVFTDNPPRHKASILLTLFIIFIVSNIVLANGVFNFT